ncbi:hypothetical protein P8825_18735 [Shouchella clausii]|uniref:hypothetical protein n=1 Tax=Shouchella clausii TaxID=79880 RepID=UPI002DBD90F7|nr:hypothetical protein [Shouchella clausii]MEB5481608.1 hypothetical protein [Shouchella clausii]
MKMKWMAMLSALAILSACAGDTETSKQKTDNETNENQETALESDKKEHNQLSEEEGEAETVEAITADSVIEEAIAAEKKLEHFSLEWQKHEVAEDGTVMEAYAFERLHVYRSDNGPDYFFKQSENIDEHGNSVETIETQTPEGRNVYRNTDSFAVLSAASDDHVPPFSAESLEDLIAEQSPYALTYQGIYEISGYLAHHVQATAEEQGVEINLWFDTETGLLVRENAFYQGKPGQVSILTTFEEDIDFDPELFDFPIQGVPVRDER